MKKVLIIEDVIYVISDYEEELEGKCELLFARRKDDALSLFDENLDNLDAIVIDGSLSHGGNLDTLDIVEHIRKSGYTGDLIANSSTYNDKLVEAGCNLRCMNDAKKFIPKQLISLLGL